MEVFILARIPASLHLPQLPFLAQNENAGLWSQEIALKGECHTHTQSHRVLEQTLTDVNKRRSNMKIRVGSGSPQWQSVAKRGKAVRESQHSAHGLGCEGKQVVGDWIGLDSIICSSIVTNTIITNTIITIAKPARRSSLVARRNSYSRWQVP